MTLIEAVKSGNRFRRIVGPMERGTLFNPGEIEYLNKRFSLEDLLAEYEIEEQKIEITKQQLFDAWNLQGDNISADRFQLAKDLGFK